jgi:hypothetical protein
LLTSLEMYDSVVDMAETVHTFGLELTPLEAFVARLFGGNGTVTAAAQLAERS